MEPAWKLLVITIALGWTVLPADAQETPSTTQIPAGVIDPSQGIPSDWTHRHLVFSAPSADQPDTPNGVQHEPRYWLQQIRRNRGVLAGVSGNLEAQTAKLIKLRRRKRRLKRDWSSALGTASILVAPPPPTYPAEFTLGASPSCNDWVVFTMPTVGTITQFNIIAFKNIYLRGTTPLCGSGPTVKFAYNASSNGGRLLTSPVLSIDGTKIAFIENGTAGGVFHVVVLPVADSGKPATFPHPTPTTLPACGAAPCEFNVALSGGQAVTFSAPFVDYNSDTAFVGDDNGAIHKITGVFGATPAEATTGGWPFTPGGASGRILTPPVFDPLSAAGNLYVADVHGTAYLVQTKTACTTPAAPAPCLQNSDSSAGNRTGPNNINDAPIFDSTAAKLYLFTARGHTQNGASSPTIFQYSAALGLLTQQTPGPGGSHNVPAYDGTFDNAYLTSASGNAGNLYFCTEDATGNPLLFTMPMTGGTIGTPSPAAGLALTTPVTNSACSPLTENNVGSIDQVFLGVGSNCASGAKSASGGCVMSFNNLPISRTVTDGNTTNASKTVISATASFTAADAGREITGTNIPANATISSVTNSTTIQISANATGTTTAGTLSFFSFASQLVAESGGTTGIVIDNIADVNGTTITTDLYFMTLGTQTCADFNGTSRTSNCAVSLTQSGLQ